MAYRKDVPTARDFSNFVIIFGYATIENDEQSIMAICSKKTKRSYYIPVANAFQFADSITGEPTDHLIITVATICKVLDLGTDKYIAYELSSAIVDCLPELVEMPPKVVDPQKRLVAEAERHGLVVKLNNETLIDAS